jgi:hypothetical protein
MYISFAIDMLLLASFIFKQLIMLVLIFQKTRMVSFDFSYIKGEFQFSYLTTIKVCKLKVLRMLWNI